MCAALAAAAATSYSFRLDAPAFTPHGLRVSDVRASNVPLNAPLTVEQLEARLATLAGPANRDRRRRVQQRLKKLRDRADGKAASGSEAQSAVAATVPAATSTATDRASDSDQRVAIGEGAGRDRRQPPAAAATRAAADPKAARTARPRRPRRPERGSAPDVWWRAVSMAELRAHPAFVALPPAHRVLPATASDLRLYRQDSDQWWACHAGRISTSACAACLGVYEERSAKELGVPPSLRGHGKALDAHARLQAPLLADYALLRDAAGKVDSASADADDGHEAVWRSRPASSAGAVPFQREYVPRRSRRAEGGTPYRTVGQVRMAWGNAQEATSVLAAANYLWARHATVEEAGLQPLEALPESVLAALPPGLPPIGASPDAIVRWPDGSVEPFEAKNHAPFATCRAPQLCFEVRDPGPYDGVAVWHVPQLYLHMLCLGEACSSALFLSCSATKGANLFRLRRDTQLQGLVLKFVARFADRHGAGQPPPPPDHFWGCREYASLLEGLSRASREAVELVAHIPHAEIQRGPEAPLFL